MITIQTKVYKENIGADSLCTLEKVWKVFLVMYYKYSFYPLEKVLFLLSMILLDYVLLETVTLYLRVST